MNNVKSNQEEYVRQHLSRNVVIQLLHGMLGQTGFRLFNAPTFLPVYLYSISGSEFFVGLARSLQALGQMLTPVLGASLIGHRSRMLKVSLVTGGLMRIQILFIALTGLFLSHTSIGIYAIAFFLTMLGFFQGIQSVMMNSLRAKVIPVQRRGVVTGWRNFLAGATTASLSYFAGGYFIDNHILGNGYAALFLLAFAITALGLLALAFTREPEAAQVRHRENVIQSFRALPDLLKNNPPFAKFFLTAALGSFGRMAMPFYILYAHTVVEISGTMLGVLTTLWMLTSTAVNLVWGSIADRNGYRIVMILTLGLWALAHLELLMTDGILGVLIFFIMIGTAVGGFNQARQNMVMELGAEEDIPLRVAVSDMAVSTIGTVGPLAGGLIAAFTGYAAIFEFCVVAQLIGLIILIGWIPEPRVRPPHSA